MMAADSVSDTFNFHSKCMLVWFPEQNLWLPTHFSCSWTPQIYMVYSISRIEIIELGINALCLNHLLYTFTSPCTNLIYTAESNWTCQERETRIVICSLLWNTSTALWIWYVTLCSTDSRHAIFWIKLTVKSFQITGSAKYGFILESH